MYFNPSNNGRASIGVTEIDGSKYLSDDNGVRVEGNGTPVVGEKNIIL